MLFNAIVDPDTKQLIIFPKNKEVEDHSPGDGNFSLMEDTGDLKEMKLMHELWYNDYQLRVAGGYFDAVGHLDLMANYGYKMYVRRERWQCMDPIDLLEDEIKKGLTY